MVARSATDYMTRLKKQGTLSSADVPQVLNEIISLFQVGKAMQVFGNGVRVLKDNVVEFEITLVGKAGGLGIIPVLDGIAHDSTAAPVNSGRILHSFPNPHSYALSLHNYCRA